jgi:hypothetical protein
VLGGTFPERALKFRNCRKAYGMATTIFSIPTGRTACRSKIYLVGEGLESVEICLTLHGNRPA